MSKLLIIGNQNPEIGKEYYYSLYIMGFGSMPNNIFSPHPEIAKWEIYVLENGKWRKTTGNSKYGDTAPYTFNQSSLTRKGIKICVTKGDDAGELIIKPKRARQPKINKIELLDFNGNKVIRPLSYSDTLTVKAYCTEMEGETVQFTLWEDDAKGEGHNKINFVNKINAFPVPGTVKKGVAEAKFNMATYRMASLIANMQVAKGDKNEGKTHEYYATAEYFGKLEASNNVNLKNPTYNPNPTPTSGNKSGQTKPPAKQQPNQRAVPPPPAPKKNTYKTPITPKAKTKSPDPQGKIISAEFVDMVGKPYKSMKFGTRIRAKIVSKDMIGKTARLKIWEDDILKPDKDDKPLFEKDYILYEDESFFTLFLTAQMRKDGDDWLEGSEQEYFLEIEYAGQSVDSEVINVNDSAPKIKVAEPAVSMTGVGKTPAQKQNGTCVCSTMKLYWGNKVSCEFRKKVIKISKNLNIDPDNFMSAMAHETGKTFDPTCGTFKKKKDESKEGYVGLIQIGKDAAKDIGTTRTKLLKMSQLDQLDYIEKYLSLPMVKGKLNTLTDFYLAILFPVDCGKGNEPYHTVFDNSLPITYLPNGDPKKNLNYWRNVSYIANPSFHKEGKKENGKTYVWEIAENIKIYKDLGEKNMASVFECKKDLSPIAKKPYLESGVWNVIITERYTGSKCTHIEKTAIRENCRRGKIEVYDHNKTLAITIDNCLLEGTAGTDRMITDADAPFGTYQISSDPFIMGSSSGDKRTAYGPNPRLSFEPINGSGDEADKSNRSLIRIHGGRQETKKFAPRTNPYLMRTHGCIRVYDADAKRLYDWWVEYKQKNPKVKPGKLTLVK